MDRPIETPTQTIFEKGPSANPCMSPLSEQEISLTDEQILQINEKRHIKSLIERLEFFDSVKGESGIQAKFPFESIEYINRFKLFIVLETDRKLMEHFIVTYFERMCMEIRFNLKENYDEVRARYLMDRYMELMRPFIEATKKELEEEAKK